RVWEPPSTARRATGMAQGPPLPIHPRTGRSGTGMSGKRLLEWGVTAALVIAVAGAAGLYLYRKTLNDALRAVIRDDMVTESPTPYGGYEMSRARSARIRTLVNHGANVRVRNDSG